MCAVINYLSIKNVLTIFVLLANAMLVFSACSFAETQKESPLFSSKTPIEIFEWSVSHDMEYISLIQWKDRDKSTGYLKNDLIVVNQLNGNVVGSTRDLIERKGYWFFEKGGLSWSNNNTLISVTSSLNGVSGLIRINPSTFQVNTFKGISRKISALESIENDIFFLGHSNTGELGLYMVRANKESIIDNNLNQVRPIRLSGNRLLYVKQSNLHILNKNGQTNRITDFTSGEIIFLIAEHNGEIYFIRQFNNNTGDNLMTKKGEVWTFGNGSSQKLLAGLYRDIIVMDNGSLVFSRKAGEASHLWRVMTNGDEKQLTSGSVIDDSPVKVDSNNILFRRNYKEIYQLKIY